MFLISSYYSTHYGTITTLGHIFSLGAILTTPVWVLRDYLFEDGKVHYLFIGLLLTVGPFFVFYEPRIAVYSALALFWAYLIDTNVYILLRRFGVWVARIGSDLVTLPTVTIFFFYLRDHVWTLSDGQIVVKYITLFVVYFCLLGYHYYQCEKQRLKTM